MHGLATQDCSGVPMPSMSAHVDPGMDMGSGHGGVCVFTAPSRDQVPVLALVFLAVALLVTTLWRPLSAPSAYRRGPPLSGARLLTLVCVART